MTDLSTVPKEVNIEHYSGDTLTIRIKIDAAVIGGRMFFAQVRSKAVSSKIDATFTVLTNAEGADIVLTSADCQQLTRRDAYVGTWDVQLAMADGSDPVTTLAFGELRLLPDVTRPS